MHQRLDLLRVFSHVFQVAEEVITSPDRTMNNEQTDRHTKTKNTKHKLRASHGPKLPRGKKNKITAAFQGGGFSPFPPGSNCLFSSLGVLSSSLRLAFRKKVFDEFADVVAVPARVPTRSFGKEMSPPWFDLCQRANSRRQWFVLSPMSPRSGDTAVRVFQHPCQPMVVRAPSAPGSSYPRPFLPY